MSLLPASRIAPKAIEWLWPGRLALGKIALLEGDPELGKTWVTCDLCARLSVGQLFPDGMPPPGPAASIMLNAEDGPDDTLRPRFEALGADLDRVLIPSPRPDDKPWTLPSGIACLESIVADHVARLVVIDPWVAYLDPGMQLSSDAAVRKALAPLAKMAARRRCAILLVRHLTKSGRDRALYRGAGSIGLIAACRSAWPIARSPLDDTCVFAQLKNNLAPRQSSLAYEFRKQESGIRSQASGIKKQESGIRDQESEGRDSESTCASEGHTTRLPSPLGGEGLGGRGEASIQPATTPSIENPKPKIDLAFRWLGPTFWTANELAGGKLSRLGRHAQAREFLQNELQSAPRPAGKIAAAAKEKGIADRTLRRAARDLQLGVRRVILPGRRPCNYWLLPGQRLPKVIPEECVVPG